MITGIAIVITQIAIVITPAVNAPPCAPASTPTP